MGFKSLCFRTSRTPVGWRERDAPKSWARVDELYAYFRNSCLSWIALDHRTRDFLTCRNVMDRQILTRADRLSQQDGAPWALTTSVLVRSENAAPSAFLPRTMIPTQRNMRWLRLWLGVVPGRMPIVLSIDSSFYGEWHAWRAPNASAGKVLLPGAGFHDRVSLLLFGRSRSVAYRPRPHLYEETLTCPARSAVPCAPSGAGPSAPREP